MQIRELAGDINLGAESSLAWKAGVALSVGIFLGAASLAFGPTLVLIGMVGVVLVYLAVSRPEVVILILLFFVSGFVPIQFNPYIGLLVGHFFLTDLLLIVLLLIMLIKWLADKSWHSVKTPLDKPLLLFCGAAIVGMVTAVDHGVKFSNATVEARIFLYYLLFFAVTNLIRTRSQLVRLIYGVLLLGLSAGGLMVVQGILGRSDSIVSASIVFAGGPVRVFNPAYIVCYIVLITLLCNMALRQNDHFGLINYPPVILLGLGLLTTIARNILVSGAVTLAVLGVILRKPERSRLASRLLILIIIVLASATTLWTTGNDERLLQYVSTYLERSSRMFSDAILSSSESLDWRAKEIQSAWPQIVQNPIFGVGMNAPYRLPFNRWDKLTYYIHNAYLWIWLKAGLLGLIPFLWVSFHFLQRGLWRWRDLQDGLLASITLGFTLAYLAFMISNLVAPSFVEDWSAAIFPVMLGINEVVFKISEQDPLPNCGDERYA